ncbi:hypothetical protein [Antrihabitans sp. YC2-6]|uniref:hypothetical protein n=1 Tax=Antrihabitans sp. YC2-6 TaxID=2799498 RepID=UPI0018F37190|nr:hypothetical protein [Antrihabitans sp. YC2-6]MBJ8344224.1 hypothetical protein [Antrihabitans sp. YC2-6]
MDLDEAADELYGVDLADFVEMRKSLVAQARGDGDKALAAEIAKLRKPTLVGWLVNILARELPDEIGGVLQLGDALRDAQRHLSGADMRRLNTQRQQLVRALARRSGEFANDRGRDVGDGALREVGETLHAAMADPEVGEQVRLGRIITAATYSGFGPAGLAVVGGKAPERAPAQKKRDSGALAAAAQAELAEAEAAVAAAEAESEAADSAVEEAVSTVEDVESRIEELREELERAEQERQFARSAEKAAGEAKKRADRDLERAHAWAEKVRKILDDLA